MRIYGLLQSLTRKLVRREILIVISTFALLTASAQKRKRVELGLGGGVNFSSLTSLSSELSLPPSRTTFNIALSGEYYFSEKWGGKVQLIYDNKGWEKGIIIDAENNELGIETDFNLNYITFPFLLNWHLGKKKNWYFHFGGYLGLLITATDSKLRADLNDYFNFLDVGMVLGVGYRVKLSDELFVFIEYNSTLGFTDVYQKNAVSASNSVNALNIGVLVNLNTLRFRRR